MTFFGILAALPTAFSAPDTVQVADSVTVVRGVRPTTLSPTERLEEQEPAAALVRRGPTAAEPVVHGASGNQAPVTLDGARIQTGCTDHMDPATSYVEGNDLDAVTVSQPLSDGGGAAGGVNVALRRARLGTQGLRWSAASSLSSVDDGARAAGSLSWSSPTFAVLASASAQRTQDYSAPDGIKVDYSSMEKGNLYAAATLRTGNESELRGTLLWDRSGFVGYPALPMDVGLARAWYGALAWEHAGSEGSALVQGYANAVHHEMDDTRRTDVLMHMDMPGDGQVQGGILALGRSLEDQTLRLRLEGWRGVQSATMTMYPKTGSAMYEETWPRTRTLGIGGSLSDTIRLSHSWTLGILGRLEGRQLDLLSETGKKEVAVLDVQARTSRSFLLPGVSGSLSWSPIRGQILSLTISDALSAPEMDELWGYYLYRVSDRYEHVGNSHLIPEEIRQIELSEGFTKGALRLRGNLWAMAILDAVGGTIDPDIYPQNMVEGTLGVLRFQNLGTAWRVGGEASADWKASPQWQFSCLGRWLHDWNTPSTLASQLPATGGRAGLGYRPVAPLEIRPGFEWELPRRARADLPGLGRGSGYAIPFLELSGTRTAAGLRLRGNFALRNPFDQSYRSALDWGTAPRPGRSLEVGISVDG